MVLVHAAGGAAEPGEITENTEQGKNTVAEGAVHWILLGKNRLVAGRKQRS